VWLLSALNVEVWLPSAAGLSSNISDITEGALGLSPREAFGVSSEIVLPRVGSNWPGQQITATYQWELEEVWSGEDTRWDALTSDIQAR